MQQVWTCECLHQTALVQDDFAIGRILLRQLHDENLAVTLPRALENIGATALTDTFSNVVSFLNVSFFDWADSAHQLLDFFL